MSTIINKLYTKYKGHWVSVSEDYSEIYAYAKSLDELVEKIEKEKLGKGMIINIPSQKYSAYVG